MRITIVILLGTLLSGCSGPVAEFSGTTVIGQDGDVTRSTNYHASHRSNVDKIKERFELPPDGAWHQGSRTVVSEDGIQREIDTFSYELTRQYSAGEAIDSDYVQPGTQSDKAARNTISVAVRRYGFVDTFRYQETYRDVVTTKGLSSVSRQLYQALIEDLADELARIENLEMTVTQLGDLLRAEFDPQFEQALQALIVACMNPGISFEACMQVAENDPRILQVANLLDDDTFIVEELIRLLPAPPAYQDDEWRDRISNLWDDSEPEQFSALLEEKEEELFGVNGLMLFESHVPFEIRLDIPGTLVETNAQENEAGTLVWRFTDEHFWLNEFVIEARSRVVHLDRIVVSLVAVLVLLTLLRRKTRKQQNQPENQPSG